MVAASNASFAERPNFITLENNFGLYIGDEYGWKPLADSSSSGISFIEWKNPHQGRAIAPYIPSSVDDKALLETCLANIREKQNER